MSLSFLKPSDCGLRGLLLLISFAKLKLFASLQVKQNMFNCHLYDKVVLRRGVRHHPDCCQPAPRLTYKFSIYKKEKCKNFYRI